MRKHFIKTGTVALGVSVLLSGCGLFGPDSQEIDPPQVDYENAAKSNIQIDVNTGKVMTDGTKQTVFEHRTLYFADANGYVVPYGMMVPKVEGIASESLSYMVAGSEGSSLLPVGFRALIPEGTTFTIDIKEDVATIDFSNEFLNYEASDEQRLLDAITWSMTEFPSVNKVALQVNGERLTQMPKGKTPLNGLLDRTNGINLELEEMAQVGQTSAVTVYFEGMTADDKSYFVPVTRLIQKTDNLNVAVLNELIEGPKHGSKLTTSLSHLTELVSIDYDGGTAVASFSKELLMFDGNKPSPAALQSIVLSLTENSDVEKVFIKVDEEVVNGAQENLPVTRPTVINPSQL